MRQLVVTLQDGIEPEDVGRVMDGLMGVRGVYSVTEVEKPIEVTYPHRDHCPMTPYMFEETSNGNG